MNTASVNYSVATQLLHLWSLEDTTEHAHKAQLRVYTALVWQAVLEEYVTQCSNMACGVF